MKVLLLLGITLTSLPLIAQKELAVNGMNLRYEVIQDSIYAFLSAPTKGWMMIGFNSKNSVEDADFKFFNIESNVMNTSDRVNIGGRNYPPDEDLRGVNNIRVVSGQENSSGTAIHFVIPLKTKDRNDFQHYLNQSFWLILAYSEEDDFQHHSRMRKHLPFLWESK